MTRVPEVARVNTLREREKLKYLYYKLYYITIFNNK